MRSVSSFWRARASPLELLGVHLVLVVPRDDRLHVDAADDGPAPASLGRGGGVLCPSDRVGTTSPAAPRRPRPTAQAARLEIVIGTVPSFLPAARAALDPSIRSGGVRPARPARLQCAGRATSPAAPIRRRAAGRKDVDALLWRGVLASCGCRLPRRAPRRAGHCAPGRPTVKANRRAPPSRPRNRRTRPSSVLPSTITPRADVDLFPPRPDEHRQVLFRDPAPGHHDRRVDRPAAPAASIRARPSTALSARPDVSRRSTPRRSRSSNARSGSLASSNAL